MTKLEKITLIIALTLLIAVLFLANNNSYNKKLIKDSNNIITELHKNNKIYTNKIATLHDSISKLKHKDTIIITKYKEKIKYIDTFTKPDYIVFYDTLIGTNIAQMDTFLCFDSITVQKLAIKLIECNKDSELLANCYLQNNIYDNIIAVQDSVIILKDSVINSNDKIYSSKIKKVKKQRNTAIGVAFTELLLIIGILAK